jgi:NADH:ubiquinone oxidoreductase subunit 6 (subunit J)
MTHYWFHFEVASILLVIGIVAAWAVIAERR